MLLIRIVFDYKIDEIFLHSLRPRHLGRKNSVETVREVVRKEEREGG
jgi:hypothetical protein